jgi:hypothetical protein
MLNPLNSNLTLAVSMFPMNYFKSRPLAAEFGNSLSLCNSNTGGGPISGNMPVKLWASYSAHLDSSALSITNFVR